jgi:hypothetical protein
MSLWPVMFSVMAFVVMFLRLVALLFLVLIVVMFVMMAMVLLILFLGRISGHHGWCKKQTKSNEDKKQIAHEISPLGIFSISLNGVPWPLSKINNKSMVFVNLVNSQPTL